MDSEEASGIQRMAINFLAILVKRFGIQEDDVRKIVEVSVDRLKDIRALIHGGTLTDGTTVQGMAASEQKADLILAALGQLDERMGVIEAEVVEAPQEGSDDE